MNEPARTEPFALAALKRTAPLLVVFVLWLLSADLSLEWLRLDNTPPTWDPSVHLAHSLYYYAYLTRMSLADAWAGLGLTSLYYPPLVHTAGALSWMLFGVVQPTVAGLSPEDIPVLANLAFMALLLFSTYSLARRCYGVAAGLLAAALVATYPILAGQSRLFLLDYPLAALTVTAMALLAASDDLTHPFYVWPLGIAAGAALWCKWSFLFMFVPPLALALYHGVRRLREGEADLTAVRLTFNVVVVLAGMLLLAGPWYLAHPAATIAELRTSNQTWLIDDDPAVVSLGGLFYYLQALLAHQLFVPLTLLALFGMLYAGAHRGAQRGLPLLLTWLGAGWLVFTLVPNKDPRFTMPLLPALAVLSTSWLSPPPPGRRPNPGWRNALLGVTLLLALLQQQAIAFGLPFLPPRLGLAAAPLFSQTAHLSAPPRQLDWPHRDLVRDFARLLPDGGKIGVLPNTAHLNYLTLRYQTLWQFLPYLPDAQQVPKVMPLLHDSAGQAAPASVATLLADGFELVVTMAGPQGAHTTLIDQTAAQLQRERERFVAAYEPVAQRTMPGGERIEVYRRRAVPEAEPWRR